MRLAITILITLIFAVSETLRAEQTLIYEKIGESELKLFIDRPTKWTASDKRPAIVFYFGGGWVSGAPTQFQIQSEYLTAMMALQFVMVWWFPQETKGVSLEAMEGRMGTH
jgi:acetyl esterase/lipase